LHLNHYERLKLAIAGLGLGLTGPASFVALSTYFTTRRGRAVGLALVGTGLGQMLMPQVVRALLDWCGFSGAMLILAALSLHAVLGAALYRPLEGPTKPLQEPELKSLRRLSNAEMGSELGVEVFAAEVLEEDKSQDEQQVEGEQKYLKLITFFLRGLKNFNDI